MARPESIAVGGYFPTPDAVIDRLLPWFEGANATLVDPCAGAGDAVYRLAARLEGTVYAVEMEEKRFKKLEGRAGRRWGDKAVRGDFFHLRASKLSYRNGCSLMFLNPPYDTDREVGRLEERFLVRATDLIRPEYGWLVFIVPYYALHASAVTLATHYRSLQCFRFPGETWDFFKQVVLIAQRKMGSSEFVDLAVEAQVRAWSADPTIIPELPENGPDQPIRLPTDGGFNSWEIVGLDLRELGSVDPWMVSETGIVPGFTPPDQIHQTFHRKYPVASRPRAAHLSAALAAGVFNGTTVTPDDPESGLPALLVKGVFDREWRKIEDKINKDGEKYAEVQVQQPKLSVSVLNLDAGSFHDIRASADLSSRVDVSAMTMADLLDTYGQSLMRGMLDSCPVLFDPARDPMREIPPLDRALYPAQAVAVQTALRLYEQDPNRGIIVLGEIGSGKSSVALAIAKALGKRKILITAPPHLLDGWRDQTAAVVRDATYMVLDDIPTIERFFACTDPMTVGVLSREKAKLGHGWASISGQCPGCGRELSNIDYAKTRTRCEHTKFRPRNPLARWLQQVIPVIAPLLPNSYVVRKLARGRIWERALTKFGSDGPEWQITEALQEALDNLAAMPDIINHAPILRWLAWVCPDKAITLSNLVQDGTLQKEILFAVPPDQKSLIPRAPPKNQWEYNPWGEWDKHYDFVWGDRKDGSWSWGSVSKGPKLDDAELGSDRALQRLLEACSAASAYERVVCGEPLFQAIPDPRRYPLAKYINRYHADDYDMLVVDEMHEYGASESAQTKAAQRLMNSKALTLGLTGSFMNGYADSVFMNMHAVSPVFREQFGRDDQVKFIDRFGYWKRVVEEKDIKGNVVEFGSHTDRVTRSSRKIGVSPGILPVFQLEHLLPLAITLQKEDLRLGIPECTEDTTTVFGLDTQLSNYRYLLETLKEEIKENRRDPERSGKLWGALAHLPGYLDLAATGNTDAGMYEIRWPENTPEVGGSVIASVPRLDDGVILPKEAWVISEIRAQLAQGRKVMVLGWHQLLLPRYFDLLRQAGFRTAFLDAKKVGTAKRQSWIDQHVIKKNADVLVVNPVAVQTGLNNLVHFSTEIWMENPMCNPTIYRQACGRVDRIGQTLPTEILFPLYDGTAQVEMHKLLLHKVAVSKAVDGLDPEEALRSAGLLDSEYTGFSIGKQLYKMLVEHSDTETSPPWLRSA